MMNNRVLSMLAAIGSRLRQVWLILGISLLLLITLEAAYRAQGALRRELAASRNEPTLASALEASWSSSVAKRYLEERGQTANSQSLKWTPYVYFRRRPFTGDFINVDSSGRRRTVQPATADASQLFFFGGSTMWGSPHRDFATIPSVTARRLWEDSVRTSAANFGEMGWVFTQEVFELLLQLRAGQRPNVVIFYDGINDVASLLQNRTAGWPQNEASRAREFELGRSMYNWKADFISESRALFAGLGALARRSQLLRRILAVRTDPAPPADYEALAAQYVASYAATVEVVEALAATYGFRPLYVWQPTLHLTTKPLTPLEAELVRQVETDPFQSGLAELHLAISSSIDSAVGKTAGDRFINLNVEDLFATQSELVFVDIIGHTVEAANETVVDALLPKILELLEAKDEDDAGPGPTEPPGDRRH